MGIYDRPYYREGGLPSVAPWDQRSMVSNLIISNVVVLVANLLFTNRSSAIINFFEIDPALMHQPLEWYRVITYGFAHSDAIHLLFNMFSLYCLGRSVEDRLGRWEFLRFYLVAVALGGIYWALRTWSGGSPMLGASGAVTAVCMLFVFYFPYAEVLLMGVIPVQAWILGGLIILGNVFGGNRHVAYDVHLVGAAFAALYFFGNLNFGVVEGLAGRARLAWRQKQRGFKVHRPEVSEITSSKDEAESDRILEKIHQFGQDSLTSAERRFMEAYSRRVRERRAKSE